MRGLHLYLLALVVTKVKNIWFRTPQEFDFEGKKSFSCHIFQKTTELIFPPICTMLSVFATLK